MANLVPSDSFGARRRRGRSLQFSAGSSRLATRANPLGGDRHHQVSIGERYDDEEGWPDSGRSISLLFLARKKLTLGARPPPPADGEHQVGGEGGHDEEINMEDDDREEEAEQVGQLDGVVVDPLGEVDDGEDEEQ